MKPTNKQKQFVKKCSDYSCNLLLLNSFGRTWSWFEKDEGSEGCKKQATISVDLKYKELIISVYPIFWEQTENHQFEIIFHEFCHVHTEHQYNIVCNLLDGKYVTTREIEEKREHETALFEKSFIWLLNDPKRYKETADFIKKLKTTKFHKGDL